MGYALLGYYLAAADKSVAAGALEKVVLLVDRQLLSGETLADAILPFMLSDSIPSMRWTRQLQALAGHGEEHKRAARDILTALMRFEPDSAPADIGGMIEALFELQTDFGEPIRDRAAVACLRQIQGSGKAAKYAAKLLVAT